MRKYTFLNQWPAEFAPHSVSLSSLRVAQINGVIESTAGMFGDLQGIAGKAIGEIEGHSLPMIGLSPDEVAERGSQSGS
jgi:hypothetical protein